MWLSLLQRHVKVAGQGPEARPSVAGAHHHYYGAPQPLLPPQQGKPRQCLVLDLDRTLIDCILAREAASSEPDFIYTDEQGCSAKVWMRPFLRQFLSAVAKDFEVVLFTAAGPRHADCVLRVLDPDGTIFAHRLYGHHTSECAAWGWVKDLSRLGRPLHATLLVDDSLLAGLLQPCNLVPIRPFVHSDPKKDFDTALPELLRFLQDKVLPAADVRQTIGLNWNKITRRPRRRPLPLLQPSGCPPCSCSCHQQLHHMINSSAPLTAALLTPARHHLPGTSHSHLHSDGHVFEQPMHHRCPAADAGCGCMCDADQSHHVLTAVTIWHRLSMERAHGATDLDDGDEVVCQCCDHGLPVLCPGLPQVPCLRSLSQVKEPAAAGCPPPALTQSHTCGGAAPTQPIQVKTGLHRSRTDWQLSSRDTSTGVVTARGLCSEAVTPTATPAKPPAALEVPMGAFVTVDTCGQRSSAQARQQQELVTGYGHHTVNAASPGGHSNVRGSGSSASSSPARAAGDREGTVSPKRTAPSFHKVFNAAKQTPFSHPTTPYGSWQEESDLAMPDQAAPLPPPSTTTAAPGFWYTGEHYTGPCYSAARMQWEHVSSAEAEPEPGSSHSSSSSSSATTRSGSSMLSSIESSDMDQQAIGADVKALVAATASLQMKDWAGSCAGTPPAPCTHVPAVVGVGLDFAALIQDAKRPPCESAVSNPPLPWL